MSGLRRDEEKFQTVFGDVILKISGDWYEKNGKNIQFSNMTSLQASEGVSFAKRHLL